MSSFKRSVILLVASGLLASAVGCDDSAAPAPVQAYKPRTRTYYIAADEVDWDYAPQQMNVVMGRPFNDDEKLYTVGNGKDLIGSKYRKALFHEYTDGSFKKLKPRPTQDAYMGMLGPTIRGVVGDSIRVVFKNNGTHPYSIHPHGVFYKKNSEGSETNDGTSAKDKADDMVEPDHSYTYEWKVLDRSGPGPNDPSSIVWLYHSHFEDGIADEYSGLIGTIVVTRAEMANDEGRPSDVDREITSLFMVENENASLFIDDNIKRFAPMGDPMNDDFHESNLMHSIDGWVFGNGPHVKIGEGDRVRWYLVTLGTEVDLHTPHWHGNTVIELGHRTDVIELLPASMRTVDMQPDNPGTWMFHCHVNDHISAGMMSVYEVVPAK